MWCSQGFLAQVPVAMDIVLIGGAGAEPAALLLGAWAFVATAALWWQCRRGASGTCGAPQAPASAAGPGDRGPGDRTARAAAGDGGDADTIWIAPLSGKRWHANPACPGFGRGNGEPKAYSRCCRCAASSATTAKKKTS